MKIDLRKFEPRVLSDGRTTTFARFVAEDHHEADTHLPHSFSVRLEIEVGPTGRGRCTSLTVTGDGEAVTGQLLRRLPIARIVGQAVLHASTFVTHLGAGRFAPPSQAEADAVSEKLAKYAGPGRGSPLTAEFLEEVAAVYREAVETGGSPTQAVCTGWNTSRSTASKWVRRARDLGLLGPAQLGRASA